MSFNQDPLITLEPEWIDRSIERGLAMCGFGPKGFGGGLSAHSRANASHGAEKNWRLQSGAAMGECAHAAFLDQDPIRVVHWDTKETYDVRYRNRWNYDTKTVDRVTKTALIWPINKWPRKFEEYQFDILVLVKQLDGPAFSPDKDEDTSKRPCDSRIANFREQVMYAKFMIHGWVGKDRFRKERLIAGEDHLLTKGTPYMDQSDLDKFEFTCAQCHGRPDGTEQPFFNVMLHKECQRFYEQDMLKEATDVH